MNYAQFSTPLAFLLLPFTLILCRIIGRKIRDRVRKMKSERMKRILLFTFYANSDKYDTDIDRSKVLPNTHVW